MLPPNVAAPTPVSDSCDLLDYDFAIMLPPNVAAPPPVSDYFDLLVYDFAIMLPPNVAPLALCVILAIADVNPTRLYNASE
jgi:hypothetical protein